MTSEPQARAWVGTLNNWEDHGGPCYFEQLQDDLHAAFEGGILKYAICGKEKGDEKGTPHLQAYFSFKNPKRPNGVRDLLKCKQWFLKPARGTGAQNKEYCSKQGQSFEVGELNDSTTGGSMEIERWADMRSLAKAGDWETFETRYPRELTLHKPKFLDIFYEANQAKIKELPEDQSRSHVNYWLWGKPGCGKSHYALKTGFLNNAQWKTEDRYEKLHNKWFDDYKYQPVVVIDDLDKSDHLKNLHMYKALGGAWPFRCEVKGGTMVIRPLAVIITANEDIQHTFEGLPQVHIDAIKSRFKEIEVLRRAPTFEQATQPLCSIFEVCATRRQIEFKEV